MTFTEAAILILRAEGKPLTWRKLAELAVRHELLSLVGTDPLETMRVRLADIVRRQGDAAPFVEGKGGTYSLRAWGGSPPGPVPEAAQEMEAYKESHVSPPVAPGPAASASPGRRRSRGGKAAEPAGGRRQGTRSRGSRAAPAERKADEPGVESTEAGEREASGGEAESGAAEAPAEGVAQTGAPGEGTPGPAGGEESRTGDGRKRRRRGRRGRGGVGQGVPAPGVAAAPPGPEPAAGPVPPSATPFPPSAEPAPRPGPQIPMRAEPPHPQPQPVAAGTEPQQQHQQHQQQHQQPQPPHRQQPQQQHQQPPAAPRAEPMPRPSQPAGATVACVPCDLGRAAESALRLLRSLGGRRPLRAGEILSQWNSRGAPEGKMPPAALAAALASADGSQRVGGPLVGLPGGRWAPAEWVWGDDAASIERRLGETTAQYLAALRRTILRRLGDMPLAAFQQVAVALLAAEGFRDIRPMEDAAANGADQLLLRARMPYGPAEISMVVLVVRGTPGKLVGEDQVATLRGRLPRTGASGGAILTLGRVSDVARRDLVPPNAIPLLAIEYEAFAERMLERGVGVRSRCLPLPALDPEILGPFGDS